MKNLKNSSCKNKKIKKRYNYVTLFCLFIFFTSSITKKVSHYSAAASVVASAPASAPSSAPSSATSSSTALRDVLT